MAAFLSGGADSTSVVSAAVPRSPGLMTLAFGFGDGPNELPYASEVARRYDTRHVEIVDDVTAPASDRRGVDLTERSSGEYRYKRSVVRTIHDSDIQVDKRVHFVT